MKVLEEGKENEYEHEHDYAQEVVSPETVAAILQKTREEKGWSVDVVAGRLKLSVWQVKALEDSSSYKEVFKHPSSLRGFIRNYAKLLGLDAEPLLEGVKEYTSHRSMPIDEVAKTMSAPLPKYNDRAWMSDSHGKGVGRKLLWFIVLVLLIAAGVFVAMQYDVRSWFQQTLTLPENSATQTPVASSGSPTPASSEGTMPSSEGASVAVPLTLTPAAPVEEVAPPPAPENVATIENSALMSSSDDLTPKILEISASGDAWLEVRNMKGVKLHTFYLRSGSTYKVPVNVYPVLLVMNKPKLVEVQWGGQPQLLPRVGRTGVAQTTLQ